MLGYVRPDTQELRVREHLYYRALYCGLCHRMGRCTGQCSRMTLSYDFVFLAAVRLSLTGEKVEIRQQRCIAHPFRRRPTAQKSDALDYCADASALLVYHKLSDDVADERGFKKIRSLLARPFLRGAYKKAKKRHPELDKQIAAHLEALSRYEKGDLPVEGAEPLAEQFGGLMEAVFTDGLNGTEARIAGAIGKSVGRWIYLADAADDFAEDLRRERFNPYVGLFGGSPTEQDFRSLGHALIVHLERAEQGFLLIDGYPAPELKEILANILYLGLPKKGNEIVAKCIDPQAAQKSAKKETEWKGTV